MTGQSKAAKAAAPAAAPGPSAGLAAAAAAPGPSAGLAAAHEDDELDERLARLRRENEAMTLELENKVLRARLGLPDRKAF